MINFHFRLYILTESLRLFFTKMFTRTNYTFCRKVIIGIINVSAKIIDMKRIEFFEKEQNFRKQEPGPISKRYQPNWYIESIDASIRLFTLSIRK